MSTKDRWIWFAIAIAAALALLVIAETVAG